MDKLEGKTTDCDQLGAMQQPQFGMPLNFYENQTSHASASQFQSAPSTSETDKAGQPGASKVRVELFEPIMEHQQIELQRGIMFYQTYRSHLVKFLHLMLLLMLLLPILMML